jgi:hypothetical protein
MRPAALSLLLLLAGCSHIVEPAESLPPAELPVQFDTTPTMMAETAAIEGGVGAVTVRDRAITGICHRHENHGAYLRDGVVTFWIAHTGWRRGFGACPDVGRLIPYRATVGGLQPGSYTVRVQYIGQISSDSYPRADLDQTVVVR